MEDRDFFDLLYSQWAKTTGAEDQFWGVNASRVSALWDVVAVDRDDNRTHIATFAKEADADFVAGIHGCFGDLVRRLHAALDEADAAELRADEAVQDQFQLATELAEMKAERDKARADRDSVRAENYSQRGYP